jgi:hypothetical protein
MNAIMEAIGIGAHSGKRRKKGASIRDLEAQAGFNFWLDQHSRGYNYPFVIMADDISLSE